MPERRTAPRIPAPAPNPEHIAKAPPAELDRPVAVVLVSWDDGPRSNSYEYSRTDPDTGVTTTCSVTESDGVVEVDMRSSPQPDSGGNTDETNPRT